MSSTLPSCLLFYNGIMHCCKILAYTSVLAGWWNGGMVVTLAGGGGCMLATLFVYWWNVRYRRGEGCRGFVMLLDMQSYSASSLVSISFQCNRCGTWAVGTQQSTLVVFFLRGHVFIMMNLKQ